ncbi:hypothetical protein MPTK1_1g06770 [Marchantia polymorpha subsp. ruderalis]|uniref:Fucosyltransferase n=2 Tax=Marchantia polymorpha TaxID=3197 RepID=A0AAF6AMB2_MARPO|nr:hypothetical protein MARPO_0043s0069 [Marchantia polymorpha]BBM97582.1 hypothetical protein Mp_1g06770 [Marchantia polymorpha subsp. ruderalis]|eukprot:PTQ39824.1 hypothetical protein MARPO_0043s0069 [Marchantia polymorpha]
MEPCCSCRNFFLAVFGVINLTVISTLIFDFSPILTKYQMYTGVIENTPDDLDWAPATSAVRREEENVKIDRSIWTRHSLDWWENERLNGTDLNWRGRHKMHDKLKTGNLWFDENLEKYFISKLEDHQFPANCSKNHWIAYQPMDSGLLSCVHVFTPVLMMGLVKGNEYTVIPIGYFVPALHENPTYDGCGESKDKHLGCFFNLTSCRIDEDQVRYGALENRSRSRQSRGDTWAQFASERTSAPGGLSVLRNWMWPPTGFDKGRIAAGSRKPKVQFWNEVRKHGSVGVHGMPHESVEHIWEAQMEFAFSSMISSWMMRQTSSRVKEIADTIMAKYSDASAGGIPLWKAPVLTVHVRQTDKAWEDPYFQKYKTYRNVSSYATEMNKLESRFGFKWQSIFLISDSGSAIESLAQVLNNVTESPDAANGQDGKRFIMYDWTDDKDMIERIGGHNKIPEDKKYSAQEHFLATLYIIQKISDYAIVQYSSNVGRFISELIGARHRVSCADRVGPNALSMDYYWRHD